ncbi:MAG TPA: xanthine dehydrogenase family protein subunit M [Gemmatimonadales bacterium]|jgi:CO/xanthine dehydrogenase FAD-binding subunit|nr:xanthine dehydrogenase family protein subunit M [Gemmatimonadales bacterium]
MPDVTYLRPRDVAHAVRLCEGTPDARPLGGGTDLMVMLHAGTVRPRALVDLWSLAELKGIRRVDGGVEIGAAEPYTGIIGSALVAEYCPALVAASRTIGAAQIQNRGTLGGNLANASPAGDTLPVLLAADAIVVTDRRAIPIVDFFTAYRQTALALGELIVAVRLPASARGVRFRKVGTRAAQAISKVVVAVNREPARIAFGSVAEVPLRARSAEASLARGDVQGAVAAVAADTRPIDDVRSTAEYRRTVAQNVLRDLLRD